MDVLECIYDLFVSVFEEKHGHEALQEKREAKAGKVENISVSYFFVVTGKRGGEEGKRGEEGERGGVEEDEVAVLRKSFLHGAAAEIFGQPIQLIHEN